MIAWGKGVSCVTSQALPAETFLFSFSFFFFSFLFKPIKVMRLRMYGERSLVFLAKGFFALASLLGGHVSKGKRKPKN